MPGQFATLAAVWSGRDRSSRRLGLSEKKLTDVSFFTDFWPWLIGRIPPHYTARQQVMIVLMSSRLGNMWDVLQTAASLLSCVYYVLSTYGIDSPDGLDEVLTILFTVDYLARMFASPNRLTYPFGFFPIIDLVTCLPVYLSWFLGGSYSQLNFVRFARILRLMRILRAFKALNAALSPFSKSLMTLVLTVLSMVFLYAGLFNLVEEQLFDFISGGAPHTRTVTFGDAIYYAVVTLASVGYGDVTPYTPLGKFFCCCFIASALVIVPMQVNSLADVLSLMSKYKVRLELPSDMSHVILVGNVKDDGMVHEFLRELFHEDRLENPRDAEVTNVMAVLLGPDEPTDEVKALLAAPHFSGRVSYIRGSAMNAADLDRVQASKASAVFIISDVLSPDPLAADTETTLRALKVNNYAPKTRIFLHTLRADAMSNIHSGIEVSEAVCVEEWRMRLMAHSCTVPGFATLLTNIARSMSTTEVDTQDSAWLDEYAAGASAEVYGIPCPSELDGLSFSDLARAVYDRFHGRMTVWGLKEPDVMASTTRGARRLRHMAAQAAAGNLMSTAPLRIGEHKANGGQGQPLRDAAGRAITVDMGNITAFKVLAGVIGPKTGRRTSAVASLLPHVLVPGQVLLNPGKDYRVKAGQTLFIIAQDMDDADDVLKPGTFDPTVLTRRMAPHSSGGSHSGHYGYPVVAEAACWSWDGNARQAAQKEKVLKLFGAYKPTVHGEAPAVGPDAANVARRNSVFSKQRSIGTAAAQGKDEVVVEGPSAALAPATAAAPGAQKANPPSQEALSLSDDGSRKGKAMWGGLRATLQKSKTVGGGLGSVGVQLPGAHPSVPQAVMLRGMSNDSHGSSEAPRSGKTVFSAIDKLKNRNRRMTSSVNASAGGAELLSIAKGMSHGPGESKAIMLAAAAALERRAALSMIIEKDVRKMRPPLHRHIIVSGSLRAFRGFLPPLREPHMRHTSLWRHVVLLTTYDDTPAAAAAVEDLCKYRGVSIVLGSPSSETDLLRCGISTADSFVLLSDAAAVPPGGAVQAKQASESAVDAEGAASRQTAHAEALDSLVIFRYLVLEQMLSTLHTRPTFQVLVELTMLTNLQVLNCKLVSKIRMQSIIAAHREQVAAMIAGYSNTVDAMGRSGRKLSASVEAASPSAASPVSGSKSRLQEQQQPSLKSSFGGGRVVQSSAVGGMICMERPSPVIGVAARRAAEKTGNGVSPVKPRAVSARLKGTVDGPIPAVTEPAAGGPLSLRERLMIGLDNFLVSLGLAKKGDAAPRGKTVTDMYALPFFAAGYAVPTDNVHGSLASAYYNADLIPFCEELMTPAPGRAGRLLAEPVPRRFHGRTYAELWRELQELDVIAIGLYRCRGATASPLPYVYTNPHPDTLLVSTNAEEDLVYVLSRRPLFVGPQAAKPREVADMSGWDWPGSTSIDKACAVLNQTVSGRFDITNNGRVLGTYASQGTEDGDGSSPRTRAASSASNSACNSASNSFSAEKAKAGEAGQGQEGGHNRRKSMIEKAIDNVRAMAKAEEAFSEEPGPLQVLPATTAVNMMGPGASQELSRGMGERRRSIHASPGIDMRSAVASALTRHAALDEVMAQEDALARPSSETSVQ